MTFSFKLRGKDWIGLYIAAFLLYCIPAVAIQFLAREMQQNPLNISNYFLLFSLVPSMMLLINILITPVIKKIISNVYLGDTPLHYSGKIMGFLLLNVGNFSLCVVTLGIYFPWYMTNIWKYLVDNTTYNNRTFIFNGKGLHLLGIFAATLLLPIILFSFIIPFFIPGLGDNIIFNTISQVVAFFIFIPYMYWTYKWMFNISYKDYLITWDTKPFHAMGRIIKETFLTIVSLGIYYPAAIVKLYEYFITRTIISQQDIKIYTVKSNFNYLGAWKTMWAQILLTIVTFGIYGAWAYCRIVDVLIGTTSLVRCEQVTLKDSDTIKNDIK